MLVDQTQSPNDFFYQGRWWEFLGSPVPITGSTIEVQLAGSSTGTIVADSAMVRSIDAEITVPAVRVIGADSVDEGHPYSLTLHTMNLTSEHSIEVDWGDGTNPESVSYTTSALSHTYLDGPSATTITLRLSDSAGITTEQRKLLHVNNVSPQFGAISGPTQINSGDPAVFASAPIDPGDDPISYLWSISRAGLPHDLTGTIVDQPELGLPHLDPGDYLVSLTLDDGEGGVGRTSNNSNKDVILQAFRQDGSVDPNFGIAGRVVTDIRTHSIDIGICNR